LIFCSVPGGYSLHDLWCLPRCIYCLVQALSTALVASTEVTEDTAHAAPTTDSLVTLLEQALQGVDDTMLEECLAVSDPQTVEATVDRLSPPRVLPLLMRYIILWICISACS